MLATILAILNGAGQITPVVAELVAAIKPLFNGAEQEELQTALTAAMARSDAAQADFVNAGRGN